MAGPAGIEPTPPGSKPGILSIELRAEIGGDGEIRTHGTCCHVRQVSNLLPSTTRPRFQSKFIILSLINAVNH